MAAKWDATRAGWFAQLKPHIPIGYANVLHAEHLGGLVGLTVRQVYAAMKWGRNHNPTMPLESTRAGYWYSFDPADYYLCRAWWLQHEITRLETFDEGIATPFYAQPSQRRRIKLVKSLLDTAAQTLQDLATTR